MNDQPLLSLEAVTIGFPEREGWRSVVDRVDLVVVRRRGSRLGYALRRDRVIGAAT